MLGIENYTGFIIAVIILNLTPGVDTIYVVTRSVSQGKRAGIVSVAGIMTGCVIHVLCAAFGLSLILSTSATAFTLVKWAGALYLIFLGLKTLMDKKTAFDTADNRFATKDLVKIYRQGVITNVLNPKVALFFLSFLPQFINPQAAQGPLPFLALGSIFLISSCIWFMVLTKIAAKMTNTLRNNHRIGLTLQKISGTIFLGFGFKLIFDSK
ncbi:MAG: LysE family translocator [Desulfobacteraceae bacterium]|nr:LysE family translocator [Desulfobacteraceae bacterium]